MVDGPAGRAKGAAHAGHVAFGPRRPAFVRRDRFQQDDFGQHAPGLAVDAARKQCLGGNREVLAAQPGVTQPGIGGPCMFAQHAGGPG